MSTVEFIDLATEIFEDSRGLSFYPLRNRVRAPEILLQNFHLVSIAPGQVRGNHAHPGSVEWLYPFHGAGDFIWQAPDGPPKEHRVSGGRTFIRIAPGVAHAMRNPGPEPVYLLAWREPAGPESGQPETVSHPVAESS